MSRRSPWLRFRRRTESLSGCATSPETSARSNSRAPTHAPPDVPFAASASSAPDGIRSIDDVELCMTCFRPSASIACGSTSMTMTVTLSRDPRANAAFASTLLATRHAPFFDKPLSRELSMHRAARVVASATLQQAGTGTAGHDIRSCLQIRTKLPTKEVGMRVSGGHTVLVGHMWQTTCV
eukprot:358796-Chlamydomonas_euryale.AAC.5